MDVMICVRQTSSIPFKISWSCNFIIVWAVADIIVILGLHKRKVVGCGISYAASVLVMLTVSCSFGFIILSLKAAQVHWILS